MFFKVYLIPQNLSESLAILIKSNAQIQKLFDAMPSAIEEFLRDRDVNSERNPPLLSSITPHIQYCSCRQVLVFIQESWYQCHNSKELS